MNATPVKSIPAKAPLYGLVLAGGRSSRMQRDKATLAYHGRTQLEWAMDLIAPFVERAFVSLRPDQKSDPARAKFAQIVDTLEWIPGLLGYFDLELSTGHYGNLVLCADADVPVRWHAHELHRRAVELAPRHYHAARLHNGVVRSPLLGEADLDVLRTRSYEFDGE